MNLKEQLYQELEQTSEPILSEVLDFLQFLKTREMQQQAENQEDLADARAILQEVEVEGTVSWESVKTEMGLS
jgi:hypothetical protein